MITSNTNIQSSIDYICSHSGFIALDENDFRLTCPSPTVCIDKNGESLEVTLEAVKAAMDSLLQPKPSRVVLYIESRILAMSDMELIKESFDGFDVFKIGFNCVEPEGAKVRIILVG